MQKKTSWLALIIISLLLTIGCDSAAVYDEYQSIPNQWHKDSIADFNFKAPDTLNPYNLFLNLRNTNDYKFSNLFLIVELNYPNGKAFKDTLEYKMAKANGEFLGSGFSDIKENKLWYKGYDSLFKFTENGDYSVHIQHAMRKNGDVNGILHLEGVTDIGFRIEAIKK